MHLGHDHCPRDDLYSLIYVFLDLICGKLPWAEAAKNKDKSTVTQLKKDYMENPEKLIVWAAEVVRTVESLQPEKIDSNSNFPVEAQTYCLEVCNYLNGLEYEDVLDYDLIHKVFHDATKSFAPECVDINDPQYR